MTRKSQCHITLMSYDRSHDRHGKVVHRPCSSYISSIENLTETLSSSLCQMLIKEQLALFWLRSWLTNKPLKMSLNYQLTLRKGGLNLALRSWNCSKIEIFMRLWTFLRKEKWSRTAGYLTSSLMVVTDLVLLPKDFLKLKTLTLMNYSLQLFVIKLYDCFLLLLYLRI